MGTFALFMLLYIYLFSLDCFKYKFPCLHFSSGFRVRNVKAFAIRAMSTSTSPSSVIEPTVSDNGVAVGLLTGVNDTDGGVIIDMKEPMDPVSFVSSLRASLSQWRKQVITLSLYWNQFFRSWPSLLIGGGQI